MTKVYQFLGTVACTAVIYWIALNAFLPMEIVYKVVTK